jgi:hypothetical protein
MTTAHIDLLTSLRDACDDMITAFSSIGSTPPTSQAMGQIGGRLSLTSGVAITETDVVGATAIYLVPCVSDKTPIYDGIEFVSRQFAEVSAVLNSSHHAAATNYDVFEYWDGSAVAIGTGPAWASATSRGTGSGTAELELLNGIYCNKHSISLRNNTTTAVIDARKARLRGSFRTTNAGLTEDSKAKRLLSNVDNATIRPMAVAEATNSWTYGSTTIRYANNSSDNKLEFINTLGGRLLEAKIYAAVLNSTSTPRTYTAGVGIDSSSAFDPIGWRMSATPANNAYFFALAGYEGLPGIGYHYAAWLEASHASPDTHTVAGDFNSAVLMQSGIYGKVIG